MYVYLSDISNINNFCQESSIQIFLLFILPYSPLFGFRSLPAKMQLVEKYSIPNVSYCYRVCEENASEYSPKKAKKFRCSL